MRVFLNNTQNPDSKTISECDDIKGFFCTEKNNMQSQKTNDQLGKIFQHIWQWAHSLNVKRPLTNQL